ncbi:MAG: dUTP diphosphatase [Oscillospiraceae bacterium]|jgi:dUTP pyrophosphatase|nr:dUTP diphosphatase [Oscillospiraceae bacterium]
MKNSIVNEECIKMIKKRNNACIPTRASEGSAGFDLYASIETQLVVKSGCSELLPSGVALAIPKNFVGLLFARSGLGIRHCISLSNAVGVIDSDYRGEIFVCLKNFGAKNYVVKPNDRIAQLVIIPFCSFSIKEVSFLNDTKRSTGGFGSTGR